MYLLEKGLRYQRVVLIVQEKTDCPISETGLSDFHGFNPLGRTSLSLSLKNNREGDTKTPIGNFLIPP
jgi:hypothetical protein